MAEVDAAPDDPDSMQMMKVKRSADHLAEHFEDYPLMLFSFAKDDPTGGSIYPATWNAMLAARGEGVGTALTSLLLLASDEVFDILGVPTGEGWNMASCVTFGYPTGRWGVAARRPVHEVAHRNQWGAPLGFEVPDPLWSPEPTD